MGDNGMKRAGVACAFLLALSVGGVFAQNMSVVYVAGDARARNGSAWVGLSAGDSLSAEDTLRLDQGAYVELRGTNARISLSEKGVYKLRDMLAFSRSLSSAGVGKALLTSIRFIVSGPPRVQNTAAGARANNEAMAEDSGWATSNAQVYLDSGRSYVGSGQYDEAIEQLLLAQDAATDKELPEVNCFLAYSYSMKGEFRKALTLAESLRPNSDDAWSPDFTILKAKLLLDSNAFAQEVAWLTQAGNDLSGDAQRFPVSLFLLGLGYRGVGDVDNEKLAFERVISISRESDLGKTAARLLNDQ